MTMKQMDLKEFRDVGYLQELNRQFLHPLGLALYLAVDDETGEVSLGGIWDCRDDPEGMSFDEDRLDRMKGYLVFAAYAEKARNRLALFGHPIQPLPLLPDDID